MIYYNKRRLATIRRKIFCDEIPLVVQQQKYTGLQTEVYIPRKKDEDCKQSYDVYDCQKFEQYSLPSGKIIYTIMRKYADAMSSFIPIRLVLV